jgi:hypothetical protein
MNPLLPSFASCPKQHSTVEIVLLDVWYECRLHPSHSRGATTEGSFREIKQENELLNTRLDNSMGMC